MRYPQAGSTLEEFNEGLGFTKVRNETLDIIVKNPQQIKKVLICSGQVYYDLINERQKLKRNDIAIIALEQIAPFPYEDIYHAINKFSNAEFVWTQEEHFNQGCWSYIEPRINNLLNMFNFKNNTISYTGRNPSSASATGHHNSHEKELKRILESAMNFPKL